MGIEVQEGRPYCWLLLTIGLQFAGRGKSKGGKDSCISRAAFLIMQSFTVRNWSKYTTWWPQVMIEASCTSEPESERKHRVWGLSCCSIQSSAALHCALQSGTPRTRVALGQTRRHLHRRTFRAESMDWWDGCVTTAHTTACRFPLGLYPCAPLSWQAPTLAG